MIRALHLLLLLLSLAAAVKIPLSRDGRHGTGLKTPFRHWQREHEVQADVIYGMRVPRKYFVVQGFGETDQGSGTDPYETGAHDLAMEDAGIHNFNLMKYTSILPREAQEISFEEARKYFHHGAVIECILSEQHGGRGDTITAGVGRMMVVDKSSAQAHTRMGGFAVEYEGPASHDVARKLLDEALDGLFDRRFTATDHSKEEKLFAIESREVSRGFGTVLAGLCFVDYIVPVLPSGLAPASAHGQHGTEL